MHVNEKNIEFDQAGEGPPMLLVHGLGGTANFWQPVITAFAGSHSIVAPDLPSAGRSDLDNNTSIESLAADMFALLDALNIAKVHLVGHSMGTIVCQHMAALAPDRIVDMVLLGPLAEPPPPARSALMERAAVARSSGMTGIADTIANVALAAATKRNKPNVQGFVREMVSRQSAEGYAVSCEALSGAARADASKLSSRCLLITGDEDGVAPAASVRALGDELANSETHLLNDCGHWTLTEQPEPVIELMTSFYNH